MTRTRREKSREMLSQCLGQIDVLLGTSTRENGTGLTPPFPISDVLDPKTPSPVISLRRTQSPDSKQKERPGQPPQQLTPSQRSQNQEQTGSVANGKVVTDKPAEKPSEKPSEKPAEKPGSTFESGSDPKFTVGYWPRPSSRGGVRINEHERARRLSQPPPIITMSEIQSEQPSKMTASHSDSESMAASVDSTRAGTVPPVPAKPAALKAVARPARRMPDEQPLHALGQRAPLQSSELLADVDNALRNLTVDEVDSGLVRAVHYEVSKSFIGHVDLARALAVRQTLSDGPQLLSGGDDGLVILWDVDRSERRRSRRRPVSDVMPSSVYRGHLAAVTSVAFSEGHDYAYSGSLDSTIKVWALPENSQVGDTDSIPCFPVREFSEHTDAVWDLAFDVRRSLLVSVGADNACHVWSTDAKLKSQPLRRTLPELASTPTATCFVMEDAMQFAVAYANSGINVYDSETGQLVASQPPPHELPVSANLQRRQVVTRIRSSTDHNILAASVSDGSVRLVDTRTMRPTSRSRILAHEGYAATSVDVGSSALVTGGSDGLVRWWDWRNTKCAFQAAAHLRKGHEGVCDVGFVGRQVASAGSDSLLKLFK
ncbi:1,2-dihydroxy-3-keto-5-methylthiopentene dioxygenase [Linderina pennispora]|nr:1,2-dihydroxy-3-keto-5-methylthiopentene dioxygenase [Linderina pennispora]